MISTRQNLLQSRNLGFAEPSDSRHQAPQYRQCLQDLGREAIVSTMLGLNDLSPI